MSCAIWLARRICISVYTHLHNPYVGKDFFTDPTYYWYRSAFIDMVDWAAESGVETFNCTGGGTLFGGKINFCDFSEFLAAASSG